MGLLVAGTPLGWQDALEWLDFVRKHGIEQFIHTYDRVKDLSGDVLKWGDETEYGIYQVDRKTKSIRLALRGDQILKELSKKEDKNLNFNEGCHWVPEYGAWMVEATPHIPYGGYASDLRRVEVNMRLRRARLLSVLHADEIAPTVTCFPLLGVHRDLGVFQLQHEAPGGPIAQSKYVSDAVINPHPRFGTLTANIRKRRGRKVDIRVPLFKDVNTPDRKPQSSSTWAAEQSRKQVNESEGTCSSPIPVPTSTDPTTDAEPHPGYVHMDCMAFGMGMNCLQVTFQAKNLGESRHLYDHLGVLSPIFLALTAATPILKGRLCDTDVRWATIAAAVDDRTMQESGNAETPASDSVNYAKMAGKGARPVAKSRYECISLYICNHKSGTDPSASLDMYNDVEIPYDEYSYKRLLDHGVDESLAKHIAHLFIRDPLVIFSERIHLDDSKDTDHWENIQSTNWQTVRWKPPPPKSQQDESHVGWRTEFRSMEIQLTDFENAAFSVFLVLVSRVILAFDLNLYIPLSKVEYNMEIAHRINAVQQEKFYFRCHLAPPEDGDCYNDSAKKCTVHSDPNRCELMSVTEIMNGKGSYYPGLIPLVRAYLDYIKCDDDTREMVQGYLTLIQKRATGELPTAATWIRRFVTTHPEYKQDSVVTPVIAFELLEKCDAIGKGLLQCPELLGDIKIEPIQPSKAYSVPLSSSSVKDRLNILRRYSSRGEPCPK